MRGDAPILLLLCQESVTDVSVTLVEVGWPGGFGKVEGSGALWNITFGLRGAARKQE